MKQIITTEKAPKAVGPYSQAIKFENLVFCSGQIGLDPKTNNLVEGIENQTLQVLKNLSEVLEAAGSSKEKVLKVDIFLANMSDYIKVNEIYGNFFNIEVKPARVTVAAAKLPKDALIEISFIAHI